MKYFHPPLPTIEVALEYWKDIDATHCKNLFLEIHKEKALSRNFKACTETCYSRT